MVSISRKRTEQIQTLLKVSNVISYTVILLGIAIAGLSFGLDTRLSILPILFMGFGLALVGNSIAGNKLRNSLAGELTGDDLGNLIQGSLGLSIFVVLGIGGLPFFANRAGNILRNFQEVIGGYVAVLMVIVGFVMYLRNNQRM